MKTYRWDLEAMENRHLTMLSKSISCPNGMINTDSSEFLKKGKESVGVARQYCGEAGKTDNCQSGVFVGYSSKKGYGLLTSQLYMPEIWFSEEYEQKASIQSGPIRFGVSNKTTNCPCPYQIKLPRPVFFPPNGLAVMPHSVPISTFSIPCRSKCIISPASDPTHKSFLKSLK